MDESGLHESLLAGSSTPGSDDDDIGTPPRLPPPAPDSPPLSGKNLSTPSPPSLETATVAKNVSSPPPAASDEQSSDSEKAHPGNSTRPSGGPGLGLGGSDHDSNSARSTAQGQGLQEDATAPRTSAMTSPPPSSSSSSSLPASRVWFGLWRRTPQQLPLYAPPPPQPPAPAPAPGRFQHWKETHRPMAPRLDSVGVEKVIGIFGFSLFGSISLLPSTMDRMTTMGLSDKQKTYLMMGFGIVWVAASTGVICGLHGKSDLEQALCRHTGRLGMLGLVLLVILHVRWALPDGFGYDAACYSLVGVVSLLHLFSWIASLLVGEDRMEDAAAPAGAQEEQQ